MLLCPMKKADFVTVSDCDRSECAWYDVEQGHCAVMSINYYLMTIAYPFGKEKLDKRGE